MPRVVVFPDDRLPTSFYAVSATPRVALDNAAGPQLSFMAYGKQHGPQFEVTGGLFSVTVSVGLRPEEERQLLVELARRLAQDAPVDANAAAPLPQLLAFPWIGGAASISLGASIAANGTPSSVGDNRCSFNLKLNASQAKEMSEAWKDGLRSLTVHYRASARSGPAAQSRSEVSSEHTQAYGNSQLKAAWRILVETDSVGPSHFDMEFTGPLELTDAEARLQFSQVAI